MNPKTMFLGLLLAVPALADIDVSISADIRLGRRVAPPPPEVVVIEDTGPREAPPWVRARHFYHRDRAYYYYPAAHVYYRPADRMWFYLDGRDWRFGVNLPTAIHVDFDHCVALTMQSDRPFEYHERVVTYYPVDYFVTRVRVKELRHDRDDDDHDRGRGKKKGHREDR